MKPLERVTGYLVVYFIKGVLLIMRGFLNLKDLDVALTEELIVREVKVFTLPSISIFKKRKDVFV